jgi:hypothetical protein
MIVEAFMNFLHGLAEAVFSWSSTSLPGAPGWLSDLNAGIATVVGMVPDSVKYFVPLQATVIVGASVVTVLLAAGGVRLARRVLSLFTGGGGNA